ncbi:hypothetical protein OOT46_30335 [Aquabacterium sp. A7-Y]|uniref:phage head-tail joining protein n=1 Tax=Aquabacterium sp. A7-Y TaxID=1349605 RepID=UPI00223E00FE|nr:hypothetical protein [Aquabacterium sp. A7-Y]MCW7542097.1 hypothetical protein [Aquabacterium sp. A7-Y]
MAYTPEDLQRLQAALAKGERRVSFGDKMVEYRDVDELQAALHEVKRGLAAQGRIARPPRQIRITTSKGT